MGGKSYFGGFELKANEWKFDDNSQITKIVYNPEYKDTPSCISVFSKDLSVHARVQKALDVLFPGSMGRGGADAHGDGHTDLHLWIQEDYRLAYIHPHDHFIIGGAFEDDSTLAIKPAVKELVRIECIDAHISPARDVIQFLQNGI